MPMITALVFVPVPVPVPMIVALFVRRVAMPLHRNTPRPGHHFIQRRNEKRRARRSTDMRVVVVMAMGVLRGAMRVAVAFIVVCF